MFRRQGFPLISEEHGMLEVERKFEILSSEANKRQPHPLRTHTPVRNTSQQEVAILRAKRHHGRIFITHPEGQGRERVRESFLQKEPQS